MSPVWSSHAAVFATAMAVSGTMIILSLIRGTGNKDSSSSESLPPSPSPLPRRRSCLSSVKKDGKTKKKVRFAETVKDDDHDHERTWRDVKHGGSNCGIRTMDVNGARNLLVEFSC
ncbi:hypothetical protein QVD17_25572 [Tagetes erecta]|uniref:Uncharacterized protein n=1 Tax=Tagetes erecta TaxID=13708 RepID=A0AAD8NVG5_TARER|nr:hypothetical protein QVD17_25572 [Tagetes erecta]